MSTKQNEHTEDKPNNPHDTPSLMMLEAFERALKDPPTTSPQYRLFQQLNKEPEAYITQAYVPPSAIPPWSDNTYIAFLLTKRFVGLEEGVSEERLAEIAKTARKVYFQVFAVILKDCHNDEDMANRVFQAMLT